MLFTKVLSYNISDFFFHKILVLYYFRKMFFFVCFFWLVGVLFSYFCLFVCFGTVEKITIVLVEGDLNNNFLEVDKILHQLEKMTLFSQKSQFDPAP